MVQLCAWDSVPYQRMGQHPRTGDAKQRAPHGAQLRNSFAYHRGITIKWLCEEPAQMILNSGRARVPPPAPECCRIRLKLSQGHAEPAQSLESCAMECSVSEPGTGLSAQVPHAHRRTQNLHEPEQGRASSPGGLLGLSKHARFLGFPSDARTTSAHL